MDGLASTAKKYTEYDMIANYAPLPDFPKLRTNLLHAFLRHGSNVPGTADMRAAAALAVSLAQFGLDTHEMVDGHGEQRTRQMAVLAGDYFSSRFYQLLSQKVNVQSIGLLSQSICEVNRLKMSLYMKAKQLILTAEEYVRNKAEINTHLFLSFTAWIDTVYRKTCPAFLRAVAECELFEQELTRTRPDNVKESWVFWYVLQHGTPDEMKFMTEDRIDGNTLASIIDKYELVNKLTVMRDEKVDELRALLQSIRSDKLARELSVLIEPFLSYAKPTKVLEEI